MTLILVKIQILYSNKKYFLKSHQLKKIPSQKQMLYYQNKRRQVVSKIVML